LAAKLDGLEFFIAKSSDSSLRFLLKKAYKLGLEIYKLPEPQFQEISVAKLNEIKEILDGIMQPLVQCDQIQAVVALMISTLAIATSIALLILCFSNPVSLGIGVTGIIFGLAVAGFGIYKTESVIDTNQFLKSISSPLELVEELPTLQAVC
jgi:hypothetical protein